MPNEKITHITLPDSTTCDINASTLENKAASDFVDLTSNQTITGVKTFEGEKLRIKATDKANYFYVKPDGNGYNAKIGFQSDNLMLSNAYVYSLKHFIPNSNNTLDLGISANKWRDLYLAGNLTDGTNSVTIAKIENTDNKVTSISNLSTDTQYPSAKCVYDNIQNVREIADGKKQTYVVSDVTNPLFNSQSDLVDLETSITDVGGNVIDKDDLNIGDTIYVTELDVPDRWVSNRKLNSVIQLVQNGNFENTTKWQIYSSSGTTFSVDSNVGSITVGTVNGQFYQNISTESNHKYLYSFDVKASANRTVKFRFGGDTSKYIEATTSWQTARDIHTRNDSATDFGIFLSSAGTTNPLQVGDVIDLRNVNYIDLTELYGIGNEPTTVAEFEEDYPLPYYPYNTETGGYVYELSKLETVKPTINSISVNGTNVQPVNQNVNIAVPTKVSDLTNDSGFITVSEVPQEIYVCTYGTTTYAEITQALSNGKLPICYYSNRVYCLSEITGIDAIFTTTYVANNYFVKVRGSDWSNSSTGLQATGNRVTTISSSSTDTQYPTAKAVYNELVKKQDTLVSGTNIKTINNESILGSGNITISSGTSTDVQVNGTSITLNGVANLITNTAYNSSTNKIATMSDVPTTYLKSASSSGNTLTLTKQDNTTVTFTPTFTEAHVGDVVSVGATADSGIAIAGTTANPTVGIASTHKLPTTTE